MKEAERLSNNASHKAMVSRIGKRITGVAKLTCREPNGSLWFLTRKPTPLPRGQGGRLHRLDHSANGNEGKSPQLGHEVAPLPCVTATRGCRKQSGLAWAESSWKPQCETRATQTDSWQEVPMGPVRCRLALPYSRSNERADHQGLLFRHGGLRP